MVTDTSEELEESNLLSKSDADLRIGLNQASTIDSDSVIGQSQKDGFVLKHSSKSSSDPLE